MVVIRESLRDSNVCRVGQVLSPIGCISIRVATTLSYEWQLVRCSHLIVWLLYLD
jgi:hypothetical protein